MARAPRTVILKDSEGAEHSYRINLHPHSDGLPLVSDLVGIIGPTAGRGLFDALRTLGADPSLRVDVEGLDDEERAKVEAKREVAFLSVLADLDLQSMLQGALTNLTARGGLQALSPRLLAYTTRDGVVLNNPLALECYAGNYGEEIRILREVIDFNGFFEALSTFLG